MSSSVAKLAAPQGTDSGDRPDDSLSNLEADLFGSDDVAAPVKSADDLGSELFEGGTETSAVEPEPGALSLEPTTGPTPTKKAGGTRYAASSGAWPKWLPSPTEAADILLGKKQDPNVTPWVKAQLAELTSAEAQALWGRPSAVDLSGLRAGVVARFRLAVALGEKPELGSKFDDKALEALLADTDAALDGLKKLPDGAPKDVQEGFASARGALARDAVALSNYVHASEQAAAKAALRPADPNRPVARKITFEEEQIEGRGRRRIVLWVVLGLTAVGTGLFHGLRLRSPPPAAAAIANLPKNIVGAQTESRVSFVRSVAKGAADKAAVQAIEAQASQQGQHVLDVGNGRFILVPAELAQGGQPAEGQKP
ncbi:MAG: hypothetical protein ACKVPX_13065 [Myxococcaceae bacterium]